MVIQARISIWRLLVFIAIVATGLAALSRVAANVNDIYSLLLGILSLSTIAAVFRRGQIRSFCTGFTLFGFGYLALAASPLGMHLPTTLAIQRLHEKRSGPLALPRDDFDASEARNQYNKVDDQYVLAGHSLMTLLLALMGGLSIRSLGSCGEGHADNSDQPPDGTLLTPGYSPDVLSKLWNKHEHHKL